MSAEFTGVVAVDDEPYYIQAYIEELQKNGYKVTYYKNPNDVLSPTKGIGTVLDVRFVLVDIMMPPLVDGPFGRLERGIDLSAGIELLAKIKMEMLNRKFPALVLTNREKHEVEREIESRCGFPPNWVQVTTKTLTQRKQFAAWVRESLRHFR